MRAQTPKNFFSALVHLQSAAQFGMVVDLHTTEGGNVGADPVRKVWNGHISRTGSSCTFVVQGLASDSINRLEGACHVREELAQGAAGESQIVGESAGTSLQKPGPMKLRLKNG